MRIDAHASPDLVHLGFGPFFESERATLPESVQPARVVFGSRGHCRVLGADGLHDAVVAGRLLHEAEDDPVLLPGVGDWVGLSADGVVVHRFARRTALLRKEAGRRARAQLLAANVDVLFVVTAANAEFNPRRLERFVALAEGAGSRPVVVLNKIDLCPDPTTFVQAARALGANLPIATTSAVRGDGLAALRQHIGAGETVALVGASGVGKSALANRLLGEGAQREAPARAKDERGRHTTAHRELFVLPDRGLLVDTPGIRELALFSDEDTPHGWSDVDALATGCRFRDCGHAGEPGCAVAEAVENGQLDLARLRAWEKLVAEQRALAMRRDARAGALERRRIKSLTKDLRRHPKR